MGEMRLSVDSVLCTGCHTCEVMCSFHHTGGMGTGASSMRIWRSNHTSEVTWQVESSCDLCLSEEQPLCVKYCQLDAVRLEAAT